MKRFKSSFRTFYGRNGDLMKQYEVSLSSMLNDTLKFDFPTDQTLHQLYDPDPGFDLHRNTRGFHQHLQRDVPSQHARNAYPSFLDTCFGHLFQSNFRDLQMCLLLRRFILKSAVNFSTFSLRISLEISTFSMFARRRLRRQCFFRSHNPPCHPVKYSSF